MLKCCPPLLDMLQVGTDAQMLPSPAGHAPGGDRCSNAALPCWPASCMATTVAASAVLAEVSRSCPAMLATRVHDKHWCCKSPALLKGLNYGGALPL